MNQVVAKHHAGRRNMKVDEMAGSQGEIAASLAPDASRPGPFVADDAVVAT